MCQDHGQLHLRAYDANTPAAALSLRCGYLKVIHLLHKMSVRGSRPLPKLGQLSAVPTKAFRRCSKQTPFSRTLSCVSSALNVTRRAAAVSVNLVGLVDSFKLLQLPVSVGTPTGALPTSPTLSSLNSCGKKSWKGAGTTTGDATVSATDSWAGFLAPFLGPILGLLFNTATGSLLAFQEHAETQVLPLL